MICRMMGSTVNQYLVEMKLRLCGGNYDSKTRESEEDIVQCVCQTFFATKHQLSYLWGDFLGMKTPAHFHSASEIKYVIPNLID